jgi:hypothetical protein
MRLALLALTAFTLLIHGYHPFSEDGGLYVAGIQYKLNPSLFPHYTVFVTEHLRFSIFAPTLAALVHLIHLPLAWVLLLVDLFSIWLTFYTARQLLLRCAATQTAQLGALCLLSLFWTLPIAGTSLYLMDPYVTGRSLSTPLSILAIAFALDHWPGSWRSITTCVASLLIAALFHPLMAAYALAFILVLRLTRLPHRHLFWTLLLIAALTLAATLQILAPSESPAIIAAERSRYYWFLSQWQWFELLGLAGPLIILTLLLRRYRNRPFSPDQTAATLSRACLAAGILTIAVVLVFAHEDAPKHLVARMQPLRIFLPIYAVMTLLLGATLTQQALDAYRRSHSTITRRTLASLPAITILALAATMFTIQRLTYPASFHIELPWLADRSPNPWVQAFLWSRANTPPDALFALDARYVNEDGEDAQTFRAIALRSALPDFSKDGGEAAITPQLAALWQPAAAAQVNLSTEPSTLRDANLAPFQATWMILYTNASTTHTCPYNNGAIKVCRLTP